jgi:hypothetical protein
MVRAAALHQTDQLEQVPLADLWMNCIECMELLVVAYDMQITIRVEHEPGRLGRDERAAHALPRSGHLTTRFE